MMATLARRSMVALGRRALCSGSDLEAAAREVVCSGAGSLDEVGGALDRLGVAVSPAMVARVIDACSERMGSGRRLLRFLSWCRSKDAGGIGDEALDSAIAALARMGDLTAMRIAVADAEKDGRRMSPETFTVVVEALVKLGKEDEAVRLFRGLERQRLLPRRDAGDGGEGVWSSSLAMVQALCMKGHAREAQGVVWHHKSELSVEPMVSIVQRSLLHGWCVHGNAKEARRVLDDIKSSCTPLGLPSFNDYLHCLCHRNLKFNPSALVTEAMDVLSEMRSYGVTPDASSLNILLSCLGRARRVKESYRILYLMREGKAGCSPDWVSYYLVVRVLYLTGRIIRGKRLVDDMLESGVLPTAKFFHGLIGVLCGTEKVDHGLDMFRLMKRCQLVDTHTYDLLIEKLCRNGRFENGKELWDDAKKNGFIGSFGSPENRGIQTVGHVILMDSTQEQQQDFGVLLKQGAEGRVFVSTFVGRKCVIKERFSKKYRHPLLDSKLTLKRLNAEARCMTKARKLGVPTPVLYAVDPLLHTLTFEYVDGLSVKDILLGFGSNGINEEQLIDIATQIGNAVGKLHDGGLVHGDLTTSNMIIKNNTNQLVLIDFGLSFISTIPEDKAVDLYVLERALISMHSSCGDVMEKILTAYRKASKQWCATTNKLAQVRQRGRKRTMIG
uniref:non-specific serine/threonine protein kinase n=1 Tax=Oryza nivara TaxID=4536 RepID=A0A0E0ISA1_ORYNI